MNKNISLNLFSMACLSMILLGTLSVATRAFTRVLVKKSVCPAFLSKIVFFDRNDLRSNASEQKQVDWKELYPFENEGYENEKGESVNYESLKNRQLVEIKLNFALVERIRLGINSWIDKNFCSMDFWIDSSKRITHFLVGNLSTGIFAMVDNHREYIVSGSVKEDVSQQAKAVIELKEFLKQNGIPFLYVQAPSKISPLDELHGTNDFLNQNADDFLKLLKEGGVDFIDMREELMKTGEAFHDFFYKTDHHWKAETGLFACPIIAKRVNEMAGTEIDTKFFDPQNFDFEIFKDSFLGSHGRTVTLAGAKMEDITLIIPKKDFDLKAELYISDRLIRKEIGGFETFVFKEHLQTKKTALKDDAFLMYMSGNTIQFIKNNSSQNDHKILFLGDSFTNVVEPFFALSVKNFDSLDLRVFDGSLKKYIKQNKPYDVCVLICMPAYSDERTWNFE